MVILSLDIGKSAFDWTNLCPYMIPEKCISSPDSSAEFELPKRYLDLGVYRNLKTSTTRMELYE